jgi:hypothetical protein
MQVTENKNLGMLQMNRLKESSASPYGAGVKAAGMIFLAVHCVSGVYAQDSAAAGGAMDPHVLMGKYCTQCHGADKQKGKIRFDTLLEMPADDRNELLNLAHEAIHFEEMPPDDEPQPTDAERRVLLDYLSGQAGEEANAALQDKLRYPEYGNLVDHERLFNGEIKAAAYTPARRWLINPEIFTNRVMDVFEITDDRSRNDIHARGLKGVTNPFVLPDKSGVTDYDTRMLSGGHLITMLGNADWIADKQIFSTLNAGKRNDEVVHPDPADTWFRGNFSPESFKAILEKSGMPTDEEIHAAINKQFSLVLRRAPDRDELGKYTAFTRSMIGKGGNAAGLKQMLRTVLLEPDFLYRVEFGGGNPDQHGRQMLTPHEAAHAISYAIGDMRPDETLLKAAEEGRLSTPDDFRREVARLLEDGDYFRGVVDQRLAGTSVKLYPVSHPKTIRFFRGFFGYPMALSLFKDAHRIEGNYINADRGTAGTPGAIVNEADQLVIWHVEKDKDVFENLLSSDKYFVYRVDDEEKAKATIAEWREVWEKLKDEPWEKDPKTVYDGNREYLDSKKLTPIRDNRRRAGHQEFRLTMRFFSHYFPRGKDPYPVFPWQHGNQQKHSLVYSVPATLNSHYYGQGDWDAGRSEKLAPDVWHFPIEQPFSIPNRKGILSHPAWLIAHGHNFATDPIKRGLWVQEKLLANRVPEVPITVDAQIPEDPDRTLRDRLVEKTDAPDCRRCHQHMNPLGLPFEMYDDFGRFRMEEMLEHPDNIIKEGDGEVTFNVYRTLPIDASGALEGTGDPKLDGEVKDALDLIDRLAKSDRARQSFLRYAFRFYLGRNETLSDSKTLIDMDRAYKETGGSFKAVLISLLSSDSFIYRKPAPPSETASK